MNIGNISAAARDVGFDNEMMNVSLSGERVISVPI